MHAISSLIAMTLACLNDQYNVLPITLASMASAHIWYAMLD